MKYQKIPALAGLELIKLLKKDGWIEHRHATHGVTGTLMAILGEKQTGFGKAGLLELLNKYR